MAAQAWRAAPRCHAHCAQGAGTLVAREVECGGALVGALALPYGGRVLLAGMAGGALRAYRFPLNGARGAARLPRRGAGEPCVGSGSSEAPLLLGP